MKKFSLILIAIAMLATFTGCGRRSPMETTAPTTNTTAAPTTRPTTMPTTEPFLDTNIPDPDVDTSMPDDLIPDMTDMTDNTTGSGRNRTMPMR